MLGRSAGIGTLLEWLLVVSGTWAQATNESSVIDGGGRFSTNATYQHFSAIGQGGPVGFNASAANLNYSGFLNTFLLAPDQDADADGVADENDPDDDDDGLGDATEIAGTDFSPPTATDPFLADTDADGAADGAEAVAGTNPLDPFSLLRILYASTDGTDDVVEWQGRGGKTYDVLRAATVASLSAAPVVVDTVTASGGTGPWLETTTLSTNAAGGTDAYYGVRVLP